MTPLEKAIKIISNGNQTDFARKVTAINPCPLSQKLVWHWLNKTKRPSPKFVVSISFLTNNEIKPSQLRPDIFRPESLAA